jgi:hypothetical protein
MQTPFRNHRAFLANLFTKTEIKPLSISYRFNQVKIHKNKGRAERPCLSSIIFFRSV